MVNLPPIIRDRLRGWAASSKWFERQAVESIRQGWYELIMDRAGKEIYMLRMWLCQPTKQFDGRWDSANSVLLHLFFAPDDDAALHDHPWDFTTTVLQGSYREILPALDWTPLVGGPGLEERFRWIHTGESQAHAAADLHAIGELSVMRVWSLVRTGPRIRGWGFHPAGGEWVPWRTYLGLDDPATPPEVEQVHEVIQIRDPVNGALQVQP